MIYNTYSGKKWIYQLVLVSVRLIDAGNFKSQDKAGTKAFIYVDMEQEDIIKLSNYCIIRFHRFTHCRLFYNTDRFYRTYLGTD